MTGAGETQVDVYFAGLGEGDATDLDGDGRDDVLSQLVGMRLAGSMEDVGGIQIAARSDGAFPSLGRIEEQEDLTKILVTPGLPTQEPYRSQSVELLKERGVDGIISFRSMLIDLIDRVEVNLNYRKSDTLQMLRLLKNYELLKNPQMDLFSEKGSGVGIKRK